MVTYKGLGPLSQADQGFLDQQLHAASAELGRSAAAADSMYRVLMDWKSKPAKRADVPRLQAQLDGQNNRTQALEMWVKELEDAVAAGPNGSRQVLARAREQQALRNAHEPGQNAFLAAVQGGFEGLGEGVANVSEAAVGVGKGAWGIVADTASGLSAATQGMYDEAIGNYADARKQAQQASAVNQRQLAKLEGVTATEEGGWVNSLYRADVLAATGRSDQAVAMLAKIPTNELEGLNPDNPNFSKNMAGLGVNLLMMAAGAREPLLKEAGALDEQAAKLAASGTKEGAEAAAKLTKRADVYRKLAAIPKQAEKPLALVKKVVESPPATKLRNAAARANRFANPFEQVKAALPTDVKDRSILHAEAAASADPIDTPGPNNRPDSADSEETDEYFKTVRFVGPDGKPATGIIVYYDPSISGSFVGPSGRTYEFTGGVKAGTLPGNEDIGAAFSRKNIATAYLNKLKKTDGYVFYAMRGEESMLGNADYWRYYAGETEHAIEAGTLDPANLSEAIKAVAERLKIKLPTTSGSYTLADIRPVLNTLARRRKFLTLLGDDLTGATSVNTTKHGIIANRDIAPLANDYKGARPGDIVAVGRVDLDAPGAFSADQMGMTDHESFPYVLKGKFVRELQQPLPFQQAFPDLVAEYRTRLGKPNLPISNIIYGDTTRRAIVSLPDKIIDGQGSPTVEEVPNYDAGGVGGNEAGYSRYSPPDGEENAGGAEIRKGDDGYDQGSNLRDSVGGDYQQGFQGASRTSNEPVGATGIAGDAPIPDPTDLGGMPDTNYLSVLANLLLLTALATAAQTNAAPPMHVIPPSPARPVGPSPSAALEANLLAMWREAL